MNIIVRLPALLSKIYPVMGKLLPNMGFSPSGTREEIFYFSRPKMVVSRDSEYYGIQFAAN